jgi:hypothetical protein
MTLDESVDILGTVSNCLVDLDAGQLSTVSPLANRIDTHTKTIGNFTFVEESLVSH